MPRILNVFWWVKWTEDSTKSFTRTGQLFGHGPIVVKDAGDATLFLISSALNDSSCEIHVRKYDG